MVLPLGLSVPAVKIAVQVNYEKKQYCGDSMAGIANTLHTVLSTSFDTLELSWFELYRCLSFPINSFMMIIICWISIVGAITHYIVSMFVSRLI